MQTPIFPLLQANPKATIDFVIDFFNRISGVYERHSIQRGFNDCFELKLKFPNGEMITQIASEQLWSIHRGTFGSPNLLNSMLMALERWFMHYIPNVSEEAANSICIYILRKSKSAAVTSVIVSLCTAFPDVLFDTACILITSKDVFWLDTTRYVKENSSHFYRGLIPRNEFFDNERIASNKLPHRKKRFEEIIINYQIDFGTTSQDAHHSRCNKIHNILDSTYTDSEIMEQSERMILYRIDSRKMKLIRIQDQNSGTEQMALISDLPNDLETSHKERMEHNKIVDKYLQLNLWSIRRFEKSTDEYTQYSRYEQDPSIALDDALASMKEPDDVFVDRGTIYYVAAVLLRDFRSTINDDLIRTCETILINHIKGIVIRHSQFQYGSGAEAAISMLPEMLQQRCMRISFDSPSVLMLFLLLRDDNYHRYAVYNFREKAWTLTPTLAHNLLSAYIELKSQYDSEVYGRERITPEAFLKKYKRRIKGLLYPSKYVDTPNYSHLNESGLQTVSMLLSVTLPQAHQIAITSGEQIWPTFFAADNYKTEEYRFTSTEQEQDYIEWLADYLLTSQDQERHSMLKKLIPNLAASKATTRLLTVIINLQTQNAIRHDVFWKLWNELFQVVETLCERSKEYLIRSETQYDERYYGGELDDVVTTYLLASPWWNEKARSWEPLSQDNAEFFRNAALRIGYHPGVIYSIARVLNSIGYDFLDQGIEWLALVIRNNPHLLKKKLQVNAEYYLEEYVQRFVVKHKLTIKRNAEMRSNVIDILNFLVDRGSICGFMIREGLI